MFAHQQGCEVLRLSFVRGVGRGLPDILLLFPGSKSLFLELKAPGRSPEPLQLYRLEKLRELGFKAIWTDNFDAARSAIVEAMGAAPIHDEGGEVAFGKARRRSTPPPWRP